MSTPALSQADTPATHSQRALRTAIARDVDEHAHNLTDWEQRYDQITCGAFEGVLQEWHSSGLQIFCEASSRAVRQSCQVWPDAYWFGIEPRTSGMRINGRLVGATPGSGARTRNGLDLIIGGDVSSNNSANSTLDGDIDEVRLSRSVRYEGPSFQPIRRFVEDDETVLLMHMDAVFGPYVRGGRNLDAVLDGKARIGDL